MIDKQAAAGRHGAEAAPAGAIRPAGLRSNGL
jgi:hypothetical protein